MCATRAWLRGLTWRTGKAWSLAGRPPLPPSLILTRIGDGLTQTVSYASKNWSGLGSAVFIYSTVCFLYTLPWRITWPGGPRRGPRDPAKPPVAPKLSPAPTQINSRVVLPPTPSARGQRVYPPSPGVQREAHERASTGLSRASEHHDSQTSFQAANTIRFQ